MYLCTDTPYDEKPKKALLDEPKPLVFESLGKGVICTSNQASLRKRQVNNRFTYSRENREH